MHYSWFVHNGHVIMQSADEFQVHYLCRRENESGVTAFEALITQNPISWEWVGTKMHEPTGEYFGADFGAAAKFKDCELDALNWITQSRCVESLKDFLG